MISSSPISSVAIGSFSNGGGDFNTVATSITTTTSFDNFPIIVGTITLSEDTTTLLQDRFFNSPDLTITTTSSFAGDIIGLISGSLLSTVETENILSGISGQLGTITQSLELSSDFSGSQGFVGILNPTIELVYGFSGSQEITASFAFIQESSVNFEYKTIEGSFVLDGDIVASFSGYQVPVGIFDLVTDVNIAFNGAITNTTGEIGVITDSTLRTLCMNLKTLGVSEYTNYGFNSFIELNGNYYGCGSIGVYLLSGHKDGITSISSEVSTPATSFDSHLLKSVRDIYANVRSSGELKVSTKTNEQVERTDYYVYYDGVDGLHRRRVKVAQGIRGTTWQITVSNEDGSDFTVKTIDIIPKELERSI